MRLQIAELKCISYYFQNQVKTVYRLTKTLSRQVEVKGRVPISLNTTQVRLNTTQARLNITQVRLNTTQV